MPLAIAVDARAIRETLALLAHREEARDDDKPKRGVVKHKKRTTPR